LGASVYILRWADGSYYVGSTRVELEQRIGQHNVGHFGVIRSSDVPSLSCIMSTSIGSPMLSPPSVS